MKKIALLIMFVFSYQFFFGTFLFIFPVEKDSDLTFDLTILEEKQAYAQIIDDNEDALNLRLSLIQQSQESIKIAVHQFKDDASANLITMALIERLKDGVEVEIIVDGLMNPNTSQSNYLLLKQYGASIKVFESRVLLLPYKGQNRLHDKFFLVDDVYGLISGRNIGERYFIKEENAVIDRDLFFVDPDTVEDMSLYFNQLSNPSYSRSIEGTLKDKEIEHTYQEHYDAYLAAQSLSTFFNNMMEGLLPVDGLIFLHNPINRWKKEPVLMNTLLDLVKKEGQASIQTPYIIFDKKLALQFDEVKDADIRILTNTIQTSPNIFASSGYIFDRKDLAEDFELYEIQSNLSRHTKTWLIGEEYLAVGSLNIDPRSNSLSTESMVLVKSSDLASIVMEQMHQEFNQSLQVDASGSYLEVEGIDKIETTFFKNTLIRIVGLFTYFFDALL